MAIGAALAALGLVPAAAQAATLNVQDTSVLLRASAGEENFILAFPAPGDSTRIRFQQPVGNAPRVGVRLSSLAEVAIGCNGRLSLGFVRGRRSGHRAMAAAASRRYSLAAGRSSKVTLRLSRRELAALLRRSRVARLRSVETGEFGPKTTIGTVTVRARRSRR